MRYASLLKRSLPLVLLSIGTHSFSQSLTPLNIGTIAPGDSLVIYYDVTINNSCNCSQVSNQGTISGSNFVTFSTDDPDTGPAGDATVTLLNLFPLPVSLYELKATQKGGGVEISWRVTAEINMQRYEVERSTDGRIFSKLGEVAAQNSTGVATYSLLDRNPVGGANYYRLRLVDNATAKYSNIVRVDLSGNNVSVQFYPNPVSQRKLILQLNNMEKGTYKLVFYNVSGQAVYSKQIIHEGGSISRAISLPAVLTNGLYNVRLYNDKALFGQLLVVQ